jgi:ribosomal protein L24
MAVLQLNALIKGFNGSIGNLVLRQIGNKTIVSGKPKFKQKESEQQRENRFKFKCATAYAKAAMLDPEKKAAYARIAKKLDLPNAYTAAITDYMRKGKIQEIDTLQYKGKQGDVIRIKTYKKDFPISQVKVAVYDASGKMIESDVAVRADHQLFLFKAKYAHHNEAAKIRVTLSDHLMNMVTAEVDVSV